MPNSRAYQVITLQQATLLLGNSWLVGELREKFRTQNIKVFTSPDSVPDDVDLDYVFLEGKDLNLNSSSLQTLLSTHSPRAIYLTHISQKDGLDLPPGIIHISYSDCFNLDFTRAPTLIDLLDSAHRDSQISLPDDGLVDYHLMTSQDLVDAIFTLLTSGESIKSLTITTPTSISLLSLAYLIRSNLEHEVKLNFDSGGEGSSPPSNLDPSLIPGWKPVLDLTPYLTKFIKGYSPPRSRSEKVPTLRDRQLSSSPPTSAIPDQTNSAPPHDPGSSIVATPACAGRPKSLSRLSDLVDSTIGARSSRPPAPEFVPISPGKTKLKLPKLKLPKLSTPRPLAIIGGGVIVALSLYFLILTTSLTFTALTLKSFRDSISTSSIPSTKSLTVARVPAVFLEANLVALSSLPGISNINSLTQLTSLSTYYRHGLDSLLLAQDLASTSSELFSYILGAGEGDILNLINRARLLSSELYESLSLLDGSLPSTPPSIIPATQHDTYLELKSTLTTLRSSTLTAKALLATAPDLLGVGDRRKYLILFQNNMELRPTGGFIGAFAIMSFENGKLYDMPIYDVYAADGQLKGHVEPPAEIKEYLGEANWYLRDSNWDPDFPTSARRAEWFLDKTLDKQVGGSIAINVYTLADLLDALGSVTIPDYDEEITSGNIFERAEYHSEVNFFPGSTQKKEFLSSVADALFNQLTDLTIDQALPVAQALAKGIDEKNTLLAIDSTVTDHTFSTLGWNGEIRTPNCPSLGGDCYSDYAMLVDANLGVNKANYFLHRSLNLVTTLTKDLTPSHVLTATYQNTSTSTSWPAGAYKTHSRLYLPSDTIFDSLTIGGELVNQEDISLSAGHDRLVVGFLLTVPIDSTLKVELRYHRATKLSDDSPTYSFYWQKQPGTAGDPLNIYLNHPLYLEPDIVSPTAEISSQQLQFSLTNITDRRVTVKFL